MLFDFLLERIPDRIYFKDRESRFIRLSRAKAERHGVATTAELIGKSDFDLFTTEHASEALEDEQYILHTGDTIAGKVEKETLPDGAIRWALTTKMPLRNATGEIIGTCGISKDITALKAMEAVLAETNAELAGALDELRETHAALKRAQDQLVEAEKAQTAARLAAGVAHEVRNPLTILSTGVDFLGSHPGVTDDVTATFVLGQMRDAVHRADAVVCTLMDTSKNAVLELAPQNLNALLRASVASLQRDLAGREIAVRFDLADDLPTLQLDAPRIELVIDAVLRNACDAIGNNGGTITIRTRQEPLAASARTFDPGTRSLQRHHHAGSLPVVVEVEDTGCGVAPEALPAVFDPFFTTKPTGSGVGLGLTLARKLLDLHGAAITLGNLPEGGAKARLLFPSERPQ